MITMDDTFELDTEISAGPPASTIKITVGGVDVTNYVLFRSASFEAQASGIPGQFQFTVKDVTRTMSFTTGDEVVLSIDGQQMYGGILLQVVRTYPFSVVDTNDLTKVARYFVLQGADYNIWFDKRVIRDTENYKKAILLPTKQRKKPYYDGEIIRDHLPDYLDVPPGVNMTSPANIDDIEEFGVHIIPGGPNKGKTRYPGFLFVQQGDTWRSQMQKLSARSGAIWYINGDKNLMFKALENSICPWGLTDYKPDGKFVIGCKDVQVAEDGAPIANDALVWGGMQELASNDKDPDGKNSGVFFARSQNTESISQHGRWQIAEVNFERGDDQKSVNQRAKAFVGLSGPPGNFGGVALGLQYPQWSVTATWYGHDVPNRKHVRPGEVMNIYLYAMGSDREHPLCQTLPLRSMMITFPVTRSSFNVQPRTYVQFQGQFGLQYSDPRVLWKFLINQKTAVWRTITAPVDNTSENTYYLAPAALYAAEQPNGVRKDFTFRPYMAGSTNVQINGLNQRINFEYEEFSAGDGVIRFKSAPATGDTIFMYCKAIDS